MKKLKIELIEKFINFLENEEKAQATIEKYIRDIKNFQAWLDGKEVTKQLVCHPNKNGHRKASKNGMNRILSFVFERRPHLFHGSLDNEPLPT